MCFFVVGVIGTDVNGSDMCWSCCICIARFHG